MYKRCIRQGKTRGNLASKLDLTALNELPKGRPDSGYGGTNAQLEKLDAEGRGLWALDDSPGEYVYFLPALAFRRR